METLYDFWSWAWERHHNPLSWYIRPWFLLPYCYFAYKRSLPGLALTLLALASSMFWFPKPEAVDPQSEAFLAAEWRYLISEWSVARVAMATLVPVMFLFLAWAFWKRAWFIGLIVVNVAGIGKVVWSFWLSPDAALSLVPAATFGLVILNVALLYAYRRRNKAITGIRHAD